MRYRTNLPFAMRFILSCLAFWALLAISAIFADSAIAQQATNENAEENTPDITAQGSEFQVVDKPASFIEGYAENYAFTDPKDRKTFLKLTEELRCPKCQNQNIADSDAPIAHDMRRKVYQLMREGKDESEVISWMKQRYGDFVHYQPPVNAATVWLWLVPILFAFAMLFMFIKRRKQVDDSDVEARLARAEELLKEE